MTSAFRQHFGDGLIVNYENYPPSPRQAALAQLMTFIQYSVIAFALAGQHICETLGISSQFPPSFWISLAEKRVSLVMGAFFFGNTVINNIVSTGAFEISYGPGEVIFSKINTGRMPRMDELFTTLQEIINAGAAATTQ